MMIRRALTGTLLAAIAAGGVSFVAATQADAAPAAPLGQCSVVVGQARGHLQELGSPESSTDAHTVYNHLSRVYGGAVGSAKQTIKSDMDTISSTCF